MSGKTSVGELIHQEGSERSSRGVNLVLVWWQWRERGVFRPQEDFLDAWA